MALGATKPATPAAVANATELGRAETVPPPEASSASDARMEPGTMVADRYRISEVLGAGGMGVVYSAEHVLMRKEVALKVLHAEMCEQPEIVARFEREAVAAAHIDHPNVAGATDFGRLPDGAFYLVLELLRGTSLRDEISKGPIPLTRALRILRGIATGVAAAHAKGIVHRDLKPENVMLTERDGDADFVKVLDFGIAKLDTSAADAPQGDGKILTRIGTVFGTPEYMAPEQAAGDPVDARADLYALGVILFEMLEGKCPYAGGPMTIIRERIFSSEPPDMSGIADPGARDLIARLLARAPEDRMQSASELVAALDAMIGDRPAPSAPPAMRSAPADGVTSPVLITPPPVTATPPAEKRSRWLIPAAIALLATIAGAVGFIVLVRSGSERVDASKASPAATATDTSPPEPPAASAAIAASAAPSTDQPSVADSAEPAPKPSAASARAAPRTTASGKPVKRPPPPKKSGPGTK